MDWIQVLTLLATMVACLFAFYQLTKQEVNVIREQMTLMNNHHREDLKSFRDEFKLMDEKWERLFERLLVQDKKSNGK